MLFSIKTVDKNNEKMYNVFMKLLHKDICGENHYHNF